jgi:hypothetical protein
MEYKAIETHYNGYRFRSRLEARWAVFFDHAHIKYEYEPQGFELEDGTRYLPDFYLPEHDYYVEVKPPRVNAFEDIKRASMFVGHGIDKLLILGNIPQKSSVDVYHFPVIYYNPFYEVRIMTLVCIVPYSEYESDILNLDIESFYTDRCIQYILPQMNLHLMELLNGVHDKKLSERLNETSYADVLGVGGEDVEYLNSCYDAARQARFEYGEKG